MPEIIYVMLHRIKNKKKHVKEKIFMKNRRMILGNYTRFIYNFFGFIQE